MERKRRTFGAKSHKLKVLCEVVFVFIYFYVAKKVEDLWPDLLVFS
jgi:hypothetical protein